MKKPDRLALIDELPDEIDTDELMYRLYLKEQLDSRDAATEAGDLLPHEEVEKEIESWLKPSASTLK